MAAKRSEVRLTCSSTMTTTESARRLGRAPPAPRAADQVAVRTLPRKSRHWHWHWPWHWRIELGKRFDVHRNDSLAAKRTRLPSADCTSGQDRQRKCLRGRSARRMTKYNCVILSHATLTGGHEMSVMPSSRRVATSLFAAFSAATALSLPLGGC